MSATTHEAELIIRPMQRSELDMLLDWAAAEGWNPGLHDAQAFFATDPEGFLVALQHNTPVAAISVVRYQHDYAFLGFYIVPPEFRGKGFGYQIWQAGMARLTGRTVGLDGVPAQQANYRKSGFKLAHRNIRYEGHGQQMHQGHQGQQPKPGATDPHIVALQSLPFATLAHYDREFFPTPRDTFLQHWSLQPGANTLGYWQQNSLSGYGVIRPCRQGWKIGPLFADTPLVAEALFEALTTSIPDAAPVYLDVPQCNTEAVALAARHGMQAVFETARMYTHELPDLSLARTYGITTFELG